MIPTLFRGMVVAVLLWQPHVLAQAAWPVIEPHGRVPTDNEGYGVWAAGWRYKAAFGDGRHETVTFIPYLGAARAKNETWRWRTTSVAFGATTAPLALAPQRAINGDCVQYPLGPVVECYHVRGEGIEQTFRIDRVPAAGDLIIRGRVQSTLHTLDVDAAVQGLTYMDEAGCPILSYGAATAIDARGDAIAMQTVASNGTVALRLDGDWLAQAELPVVVDPLIQVVAVTNDDVVQADTVSDPGGSAADSLWVCYERAASAIDSDIWLLRLDDTASNATLAYADLSASWSTTEPSCAFLTGSSTAIAAWTHEDPGGSRTVRWVGRGQYFTPERTVPPPAGSNDWRPDIGGSDAAGPWNAALLVFQREQNAGAFAPTSSSLVMGVFVDPTLSSAHQTSPDFVVAGGGFDNERPTVNQRAEATPDHAWLVGWQKYLPFPNPARATWDIAVRKVGNFGTLTAASELPGVAMRHDMTPQIAGSNGRYLIAFAASDRAMSSPKPSGAAGHELHAWRVDWPTLAPYPTYPHPVSMVAAEPAAELAATGCSFDEITQSHWLIATHNLGSNGREVITTGFEGSLLRIDQIAIGTAGAAPAIAGISFHRANQQHIVATGTANGMANGQLEVAMLTLPIAPAQTISAPSCSQAGIAWSGSQVIGAEHPRIVVAGAGPDALHVVFASLAPTQQPLAGIWPFAPNCWQLLDAGPGAFLTTLPPVVGAVAEWVLPLPASLPAFDLHLQGVHTTGGLVQLASTARLTVPLVR